MLKNYFHDLVCVYTTTRLIRVHSPLVSIVSFIITLTVLWSYIAGMRLDYRRAYKSSCPVQGAVISKVKGYASTEQLTDAELNIKNPELYRKIWDASDLVLPVQGGEGDTGGFTVVTNLKITANQTRGVCSEKGNATEKAAQCKKDEDCEKGYWTPKTFGILTGKCDNSTGSCEVKGWCPMEDRILPRDGLLPLLEDVQDFTVLLKNAVEFPGCTEDHGSNMGQKEQKYFMNCTYDEETDPLCPIFRIGDIVEGSGQNFSDVAVMGGAFRIRIVWKCDFDHITKIDECIPKYKFSRVDVSEGEVSQGWNFRSADYHRKDRRTITKNFGLKIIVNLEGEGRKRDIFLFVTTLGSYLGLFSVVSLVCDLLLEIMNYLRKKGVVSPSFHEYSDRCGDEADPCLLADTDDLQNGTKPRKRNGAGNGMEHDSEGCTNRGFADGNGQSMQLSAFRRNNGVGERENEIR